MRSVKALLVAAAVMGSPLALANGNLHSLIVELENINRLVALQAQQNQNSDERWVFRYDLLQQRINGLIKDIDRHIELLESMPRLERFDRD